MRWMSRSRLGGLVVVILCLVAGTLHAGEALIGASDVRRVVNPSEMGDVRYLCTFELPESLRGADVVWARLTLNGHAEEVVPLVAGPLEFAWSVTDSWETLASMSGSGGAFNGVSDQLQVVANDIASVDGQNVNRGFEFSAGQWVRGWLTSTSNHGICIRRLSNDSTDVSLVLPDGGEIPKLLVVYVK